MTKDGLSFYDSDAVFETYIGRRQRVDNPNDTLEQPVMMELMSDVSGQRILDIGCGDAAIGRDLLAAGCKSYLGVEGSVNMVAAARERLLDTNGELIQADLSAWSIPPESFDLVISRLVLHYLPSLSDLFARVYNGLVDGGRFIFSVEHPVITSSDAGWRGQGERGAWLVDDYFNTGARVVSWLGDQVVKYHHTLEDYFLMLQQAGFVVEQVRESRPQRQYFADETTYQRRQRIPLFLFLAGSKPVKKAMPSQ